MYYLVVTCKELLDSYECEVDRKPHRIINEDWKTWTKKNLPRGSCFEVYKINSNGELSCIKNWDR